MINLIQKEFIGQTVPKEVEEFYDYELQGSYKVHIPELMPHLNKDEGVWCKNHSKKWSAFYVNEETQNEPNTIYLIYNRDDNPQRRTVYRIDETGVHIWTRDNMRVRLSGDENYQIDGDKTHYLKGNEKYNTDGDRDYHLKGNSTSKFDGNYDHTLVGN